MKAAITEDAASLCVGCALCCNGTLYGRARVTPGEEPRILEHGLKLEDFEDKTYFRLPCKYEKCSRCTIYETRFDICRSFKCALLKDCERGDVSLAQGRAIVERAIKLRAAVAKSDPGAVNFQPRQELRVRLQQVLADGTATDRAATAQRLLNMAALDALLERRFRNKKLADHPAEEPLTASSNS